MLDTPKRAEFPPSLSRSEQATMCSLTNTNHRNVRTPFSLQMPVIQIAVAIENPPISRDFLIWALLWARQDSNLRPTDYESAALTN
jgi:hypothetical protein